MTDGPIDQDGVAWRTLMQAALESMDEGFSVFDHNLRLLAWNKRFLEQYGIPDSYAQVGTKFQDLMRLNAQRGEYGPGDIEQLVADRVSLARQFMPHAFERTMRDGRVFEIRGNPIPGIGFVSVYKEVTERRHAQQALEESRLQLEARVRERTAKLQASEDWIRRVADAVPVLIGYVDAARRYQFANQRHEEWFGLSAECIVGRPVTEVLGAAALDADVEQHIETALAGREVSYEFPLTLPGGRRIAAAITYRPHFGTGNEVLGYFVLGLDVTEQRQAEAILRQGQKMQAVGQLTGGLAHDFNNLLTIIIGNLALALDEDGETGPLIKSALDGARRGAALVRRLLAFARQQPIDPQIYNANQVVAGMKELLERTLGGSIQIDVRRSEEPCLIRADPNELENAVLNLAINSRDAMPAGGKLDLSVETIVLEAATLNVAAGDYVVISVTDTGTGMSSELLERAFEPFFTTKQSGDGSGLGLSMVYGFARRCGGKTEIDSEPGRGTTVRICLPCASARESSVAQSLPTIQQVPNGHERVLVVEDEPAVRKLLATMLRRLGYEVMDAQDAQSALELLGTAGADLMLTDIDMPGGMNGMELAAEARRRMPTLEVLLMSGYPDKALEQTHDDDERYELIAKPFESAQLAEMVRTALDRGSDRAVSAMTQPSDGGRAIIAKR